MITCYGFSSFVFANPERHRFLTMTLTENKNTLKKISKLFLTILILVIFYSPHQGQEKVDSLKTLIYQCINDSVKANLYNTLSYTFYRINQDSSLYYANKALDIANKKTIITEKANAFYNIGRSYFYMHHYNLALQYMESALNIYRKAGSVFGEALMLNSLGIVYRNMNKADESITYMTEAYQLFKKINNKHYQAITLGNLGRDYLSKKEYDKAQEYLEQSIKIEGASDNPILLMQYYISMGDIYLENRKDYKKAIDFYRKGIVYAEKANSLLNLSEALGKIGYACIKTGEYDTALYYIEQSINFYDRVKSKTILKNGYQQYIEYYKQLGDYKKAFEYSVLLRALEDSIFTKQANTKMAEFEVMYKTLKQEETIKHLNDQKQIQQLRMIILLVIVLLVIFIIIFVIKYYREKIIISNREKKELQDILELRDKELASTALNFAQNNDLLAKTTKKLIRSQQMLSENEQQEIQSIINELRARVSLDSFREFELRFLKVHNDFYSKLRADFPKLSPNDLKMCALLRLNLSSKDIANILHMSSASVNVTRSRIRKKMGLSKQVNLVSFLMEY